jgi:DNA-binding MarR family transcriptional regulator
MLQIRSKYPGDVSETADLDPAELGAYFVLMEVSSLLEHAVDQQLRAEGDITNVQFAILMRLLGAPAGRLRMTDLADGIVHSRSGLTYQAGLLEKAGLITRAASADDERATTVAITDAGRERVAKVLPGHVDVARRMLIDALVGDDLATLTGILTRVRDQIRTAPPRSAAPRRRAP